MQSRQTRTTTNNTPIKKRLKKRIRLGSRIANARNSRNKTIVEKVHLSRDLDYKTQDYMLDIF
jgi:ribosome-binding factor A